MAKKFSAPNPGEVDLNKVQVTNQAEQGSAINSGKDDTGPGGVDPPAAAEDEQDWLLPR